MPTLAIGSPSKTSKQDNKLPSSLLLRLFGISSFITCAWLLQNEGIFSVKALATGVATSAVLGTLYYRDLDECTEDDDETQTMSCK